MAEQYLCCEGDTDRTVFDFLNRDPRYLILPQKPKPCTIPEATSTEQLPSEGREVALNTGIDLVKANVPRVIIALDLDTYTETLVFEEVERTLAKHGVIFTGGKGSYDCSGTKLSVIAVGIPQDPTLKDLGVTSHAMDDYLISLFLNGEAYTQVVQKRKLKAPAFEALLPTIKGCSETIRKSGVTVASSKQFLDLLRAILGFRASPSSLAAAILRHSPPAISAAILKSLSDAMV